MSPPQPPTSQQNSDPPSQSSTSKKRKRKAGSRKPIPLAKTPMKSRKKARQVTTLFHKLTGARDVAMQEGNVGRVRECTEQLDRMGGRAEYQRASQVSTSFHSTSKWVLGKLRHRKWLQGFEIMTEGQGKRRPARLLEVGAINTELLDAAAAEKPRTKQSPGNDLSSSNSREKEEEEEDVYATKKFRLDVRAIDLHAMDERIEEMDFLKLPFRNLDNIHDRYDIIVCSMVINCVTTPKDRGVMLARLYHHVRPGGLVFLTLPKFCLTKSAFLTMDIFLDMLGRKEGGLGFVIEETKESPRVAFFILKRPLKEPKERKLKSVWKRETIRNKGKKFPNQFSAVLSEDEVFGRTVP